MTKSKIYIYGRHAIAEALEHAPQTVRKIYLSPTLEDTQLRNLIRSMKVPVEALDKRKVTSMVEGNAPHQGVVALVSLNALVTTADIFLQTFKPQQDTLLILLSEVQDPHNVGAIIRSAAAFGAAGVLMPTYKQSPITGGVIKASAGSVFQIPLIAIQNMQQIIALFKKKGFRVYGLAADGGKSLSDEQFEGPTLLVLGNEAQGIVPAARVVCDEILSVPMAGGTESLNVAASAAVALYAWSCTRKTPL
jgi:23S rRNA (guanosine2251-2'-O)-methyltransferase